MDAFSQGIILNPSKSLYTDFSLGFSSTLFSHFDLLPLFDQLAPILDNEDFDLKVFEALAMSLAVLVN